jgi:hypothetical protein
MAENVARSLARTLAPAIRRADFRHRRAQHAAGRKRRVGPPAKTDDDRGLIWLGAPA